MMAVQRGAGRSARQLFCEGLSEAAAVARAAAVEAARCAVELHEATPAASAHVCIDHAMDRLRAARDAEPAGGEEEAQRVEALLRRAERARDLAREGRP